MTTGNHGFQHGLTSAPSHTESSFQQLSAAFRESPYQELRGLECACRQGELTVRGRVSSYYLKQLALCVVQRVGGVIPVNISIEVE